MSRAKTGGSGAFWGEEGAEEGAADSKKFLMQAVKMLSLRPEAPGEVEEDSDVQPEAWNLQVPGV